MLKDAIAGLSRGGSSKLAAEMSLIRLCDERLSYDASALLSRISRLEDGWDVSGELESETTLSATVNPVAVEGFQEVETELDPEPPALAGAVESSDYWADILSHLGNHPSVRALLSDSSKVQVKLDGDVLAINMSDSFTADMIESEYISQLKEAAEKALGRVVSIRVEKGGGNADESKRSKLENLSAFGIVNFE